MTDPIIPSVVTQVVATVSGAIVSVCIPLILTKLNKLNTLHTTVFGIQEASTVGGLTEDVEENKDKYASLVNQVENNTDDINSIKEDQSDIKSSLSDIKSSINSED